MQPYLNVQNLTKLGAEFEVEVITEGSLYVTRRMSYAPNIRVRDGFNIPLLWFEQISIILCYCFFSRVCNTVK